jgi:hypothetical protein
VYSDSTPITIRPPATAENTFMVATPAFTLSSAHASVAAAAEAAAAVAALQFINITSSPALPAWQLHVGRC